MDAQLDERSYSEEWTDEQRAFFTKAYRFILTSQDAMKHPTAPRLSDEHWSTVAHNAAWLATTLHVGNDLAILDVDTDTLLATSEAGPMQ